MKPAAVAVFPWGVPETSPEDPPVDSLSAGTQCVTALGQSAVTALVMHTLLGRHALPSVALESFGDVTIAPPPGLQPGGLSATHTPNPTWTLPAFRRDAGSPLFDLAVPVTAFVCSKGTTTDPALCVTRVQVFAFDAASMAAAGLLQPGQFTVDPVFSVPSLSPPQARDLPSKMQDFVGADIPSSGHESVVQTTATWKEVLRDKFDAPPEGFTRFLVPSGAASGGGGGASGDDAELDFLNVDVPVWMFCGPAWWARLSATCLLLVSKPEVEASLVV